MSWPECGILCPVMVDIAKLIPSLLYIKMAHVCSSFGKSFAEHQKMLSQEEDVNT